MLDSQLRVLSSLYARSFPIAAPQSSPAAAALLRDEHAAPARAKTASLAGGAKDRRGIGLANLEAVSPHISAALERERQQLEQSHILGASPSAPGLGGGMDGLQRPMLGSSLSAGGLPRPGAGLLNMTA